MQTLCSKLDQMTLVVFRRLGPKAGFLWSKVQTLMRIWLPVVPENQKGFSAFLKTAQLATERRTQNNCCKDR